MQEPKLAVAKVELRFDTEGTLQDCLPSVHRYMQNKLGVQTDSYTVSDYAIDDHDQCARIVTVLMGVE